MLIQIILTTRIFFSSALEFENQIDDIEVRKIDGSIDSTKENMALGTFHAKLNSADEDLWSATYCLRTFLENFLHRVEETPVFIASGAKMSRAMSVVLHTMLDGRISIYLLSGNLSYNAPYSSNLNAILLAEDPETLLRYSPPNLSLLCSRECLTYIVILVKEFKDDRDFLEVSGHLIQSLWTKRVGNVAIFGLIEDVGFVFAKSQYFQSRQSCRPQRPVILGACSIDGPETLQMSRYIFTNIQANKCTLRSRFFTRVPYAYKDRHNIVTGVEGEILRALSKFVNFNYKDRVIFFSKKSTINQQTLLDELLVQGNITYFAYGGIRWKPENDIDFTIPYEVSLIKKLQIFNI